MAPGQFTVRAAEMDDLEPVNQCLKEAGFKIRSRAGWEWLFNANPACAAHDAEFPIGWVIESGGGIAGYLANIALDYAAGERDIAAVTCSSYYVQTEARSQSLKLMTKFFRQPGCELFLSTTANSYSQPIYKLFKAVSPPGESFSQSYVWLADDRQAIKHLIGKTGHTPDALTDVAAALLAPVARTLRSIAGLATPRRHSFDGEIRNLTCDDIGPEFDRLWMELRGTGKLLARRDRAALSWYVRDPDMGGTPTILAAYDTQGLAGYAIGARHQPAPDQLSRMKLLDFITRPGADHAVSPLINQLVAEARSQSTAIVYMPRSGEQLRLPLKAQRPYIFKQNDTSHFARATDKALTRHITSPGNWFATGLDGDTPFCIENGKFDGVAA